MANPILNIVPKETLLLLNQQYNLNLSRMSFKELRAIDDDRELREIKHLMENNRGVNYDKATY